ncbi:hypothetical protein CW751_12745 [Brumimicrobium salinarum]|uniref:Lipopolysaccharide biosynthesis protein n=1 Tax=Brumimicrobium salinarum TaxID=2058658 RepID=A0A2I0R029_9FLAO|nr:lipopolysaccharide biosynthesis protein [Brumimicrobium salinarum]PKR79944.1 hypothetical protein CW751_12745 [Brumimicrobium salinarum]
MTDIKKSIVSGFIWSILGQGGYLIIGLVANIILARLLTPFEFGQVGIIMFFIVIAKVLTESGLSGALIRKNDATDEDFSTVFIFNLIISIVLMLLIIGFSGTIANFYDDPQLKYILIASSSVLLFNAFQITKNARLIKDLKFKRKSKYEVLAILCASIIGITLAFYGYGVWSIVLMQISTALILTLLLWIFEPSIKKLVFRRNSFKSLYKFGVNTTLASLLNTAFDNIYQLILGRYFAISQTGLYYQGKKLQEVPVGVIKSTTLGVVFASLSKVQDDSKQFDYLYNKIVAFFTVIIGAICLFVFFYAENIIMLLYGEKWIDAVFYLQILIVSSFFYMQEMFNRIIFKVFDRTEKILHLEVFKKAIQSISIIIGVILLNIEVLMYGFLITSIISFFINFYVSRKILGNVKWDEVILVFKVALISITTGLVGFILNNLFELRMYQTFYLIPVLILIFILGVQLLKVINFKNDVSSLLRTLKK